MLPKLKYIIWQPVNNISCRSSALIMFCYVSIKIFELVLFLGGHSPTSIYDFFRAYMRAYVRASQVLKSKAKGHLGIEKHTCRQ